MDFQKVRDMIEDSLWHIGMAATKTFIGNDGMVHVNVLSIEECIELKEKIERGEVVSKEYTTYPSRAEINPTLN